MDALVGMAAADIAALVAPFGEPAYRGKQIAEWLYRRRSAHFDGMSNLPAKLRARLAESHVVRSLQSVEAVQSRDGATKHIARLGDGNFVESVHLPYPDRVSVCLSSQVGCPVRCAFCATGRDGLVRNLTTGEIVEQFLLMQDLHPNRRISHAVFMGMGEPLLNAEAVIGAIRLLRDEVQVSARNLTVSTVGIVHGMRQLTDAGLPVGLAVSVHAPTDELRARLIPTARGSSLAEVMDAACEYRRATGRDVTYEYLLLSGVNDGMEDAAALARLLKGRPGAVNLIAYNPVEGMAGFVSPAAERVEAFRRALEAHGRVVTQRQRRGSDVSGACGQLAGKHADKGAGRAGRAVDTA